MPEVGFNNFRRRLCLSPLESITSWVLFGIICYTVSDSGEARPPLRVCGHVYARPPRTIFRLLWTTTACFAFNSIVRFFIRFVAFRRHDRMRRTARIMPSAFYYNPYFLVALYPSLFTWVPMFYVLFVGLLIYVLWDIAHELNILCISVIALVSANFLLSVFNTFLPPHWSGVYAFIVQLLTVMSTDYDYDDVGLAERDWDPTESERAVAKRNTAYRDVAGAAAFGTKTGCLFVLGSSNIGFLFKQPAFKNRVLQALAACFPVVTAPFPVEVNKEGGDFRVLPVRLPYALVWYSIYGLIGAMGGYKGAEEIDKCLIWLALVSALAAFFVFIVPGPCIVIPPEDEDALTDDVEKNALMVGENSNSPNEGDEI